MPAAPESPRRLLPVGADVQPGGGVHFRVWAPERRRVVVVLDDGPGAPAEIALAPEAHGYWQGFAPGAGAGTRYRYRLDADAEPSPDPASRYQPEGPHGPSEVVDPLAFGWTDADWRGPAPGAEVIYELHVGTFTPEGTFEATRRELPELARLGITVVELMPVATFSGPFGWGYDGVDLFAPYPLYGTPDDLRRLVDTAHRLGMAVVLDVVYNHLGPDGNCLPRFSPHYFSKTHHTDWGEALNYDGPHCAPVRELMTANAAFWVREYHFDGLRLDATQDIYDTSPRHILADLAAAARQAAGPRRILLIGENEPQDARLLRDPASGGYGLDMLWNDDLHHSATVALTGRREAYFTDYTGSPQELVSAAKYGFLFQGQRYRWQKKRRGTPALDLEPSCFVACIQNHDQVANYGAGLRVHALTSPGRFRAMTAYLLLGPATPMLFQGQEFAATSPFLYFADPADALRDPIREGRHGFMRQFPSVADAAMAPHLPDPADATTFLRAKLDLGERQAHAPLYRMHADLLALRRSDPVLTRARRRGGYDGAVVGPEAFVLRFFDPEGAADRLLVVNLGAELRLDPSPEPLLGPPAAGPWQVRWSSEDPAYGGSGTYPPDSDEAWRVPPHAALLLTP